MAVTRVGFGGPIAATDQTPSIRPIAVCRTSAASLMPARTSAKHCPTS